MECFICKKQASGSVVTPDNKKKIAYCSKHESAVKIASLAAEDDSKAFDKLKKKHVKKHVLQFEKEELDIWQDYPAKGADSN